MDSSFVDHEEEVTESVQYICDNVGTLTHPSLILDVTQSHTQKRMNNAVVKHLLPATIWQDIERLMNHTSPICFAHTVGKTTIKSIH
uniref:Uncharacterized protein n=1 Tax=Magallana gigas TaxID=29159 RepID=K1Q6L1_MAGGI